MPAVDPSLGRRAIRWLWIAGFAVGVVSHASAVALEGRLVYAGYPTAVRVFWASLALIDALVIALLWRQRRSGVVLALLVMVVDLVVNVIVSPHASVGQLPGGVVRLGLFTVFVLVSGPALWRWFAGDRG